MNTGARGIFRKFSLASTSRSAISKHIPLWLGRSAALSQMAAFAAPAPLLARARVARDVRILSLSPFAVRLRRGLSACAAPPAAAAPAAPIVEAQKGAAALRETGDVRVRFAPSPTGALHVGGARTALYNWLHAKRYGGKFLVRIEDTDRARSTRESEEAVLADLRWLGLHWDEGPVVDGPAGPYRQSEREHIYREYAERLLAAGLAYPCFCDEEELTAKREAAEREGRPPQYDGTWRDADPAVVAAKLAAGEPHTVRFRIPKGERVVIDDIVRKKVAWDAEDTVGDFILLRSSGVPVYNFCVAVDDALMGVNTVIRAEEHLTNTLRQVLILRALGFPEPAYAHCSLILGADKQKLSKRHGATSVTQFKEDGFLPQAMINYLATLGWSDGSEKEVYTVDQLIDAFDIRRITKSPAMFDVDKLTFINGLHLRAMDVEELAPLCVEAWTNAGIVSSDVQLPDDFTRAATEIVQGALSLVNDAVPELRNVLSYPLQETLASDEAEHLVSEGAFEQLANAVLAAYDDGSLPRGDGEEHAAAWKKWVKATGKELGLKGKKLFHPLRLVLTGKMSGPDVGAILRVLHLGDKLCPDGVSLDARIELLRQNVTANK